MSCGQASRLSFATVGGAAGVDSASVPFNLVANTTIASRVDTMQDVLDQTCTGRASLTQMWGDVQENAKASGGNVTATDNNVHGTSLVHWKGAKSAWRCKTKTNTHIEQSARGFNVSLCKVRTGDGDMDSVNCPSWSLVAEAVDVREAADTVAPCTASPSQSSTCLSGWTVKGHRLVRGWQHNTTARCCKYCSRGARRLKMREKATVDK